MNKSVLSNLAALGLLIGGYYSPWYKEYLFSAGIFALSGALTNWLAVYMLFEKVPFMYGSGAVLIHFEDMKTGFKELVMEEFFDKANVHHFLEQNGKTVIKGLHFENFADMLDYDEAFEAMKAMIFEGGFGAMLQLFGGKNALEKIRPLFRERCRSAVGNMLTGHEFREKIYRGFQKPEIHGTLASYLEQIVEDRLRQLTPVVVKNIMKKMIREHLDWLVVWGGIVGGILGAASAAFGYIRFD